MKLLTFTSLFPSSAQPTFGIFVYQRLAHLARRGHKVVVVSPVPYVPRWMPGQKARAYRAIPREEVFGELQVFHPRYLLIPKIGVLFQGLLMFLGARGLVRRLANSGMDCIDAHYVYPDGFAAALLGRMLKLPVVVSARGSDMTLYPNIRGVRSLMKWTLRRVTGAVAVCDALRDAMLALGAPPEQVKTIGNGVDLNLFQPVGRDAARARLGIPQDAPVIVSVASLVPVKRPGVLVDAVAELRRRGSDVRLYLCGDGELRATLQRRISELALSDRVFLMGRIANDELKYWYSAADVTCLVSAREGWANVLLESMACGTPVVATRVWGTPEVVRSEDVGILVDQSTSDLVRGLDAALARAWSEAKIIAYARSRTWDVVAAEVEQWFTNVLARTAQPGTAHEIARARASN